MLRRGQLVFSQEEYCHRNSPGALGQATGAPGEAISLVTKNTAGMKCSARMCQWEAKWTCRVCGEPRCIYHGKSISDTQCDCGSHASLAPREEYDAAVEPRG